MRVPVRRAPQTRIGERQLGYARPVAPLDISPLTRVVEGVRDQLFDDQEARQRINLNRRLIEEVNELQTDFSTRQRNPEISPIDFAANTDTVYRERHSALLAGLRQEGYGEDLLNDFETRLGSVRQGFFERGLVHQATQLRSRAGEEIEAVALSASQYAAEDPVHNYQTAREMVQNSVRTHPDLTEEERNTVEDAQVAIVRNGAARAFAIKYPQLVVDRLDPQGLTAPHSTTAAPATGSTTEVAPPANTGQRYNNGWAPRQRNGGDNTDAQVDAYINTLANGMGITPDTRITEANLPQMAQIMARVESGGSPSARSVRNNNPGNIQDGRFARSQPGYVGGDGRFARFNTPQAGQNAQVALLRRYLNRGQVTVRTIIEGVPAGYSAPAQQAAANDVVPREAPAFRPAPTGGGGGGTEPDEQTTASTAVRPEPIQSAPGDISSVRTGVALLDDLNGPERIELLSRAREQLTRVNATQRAEMDVRIQNYVAERMSGEAGSPLPDEAEVLRLYGPVDGPQHMARMRAAESARPAIIGFRTQSGEAIQRALDAIKPQPGSPTYATQWPIYEAAQRAADALLTERSRDPAAYALRHFPSVRQAAQSGNTARYYAELDRVYQTLGIDTRNAPVLTSEATQNLSRNYRTMNPQQRREFMQQNMAQMGEVRFRRFVGDMEGTTAESDARIFALLRDYPRGAPLYEQILEGREAIAQDPARRPRSEKVLEVFRRVGLTSIRDLNAETSRAIQDAAEGLYVQRGGDPVNINESLYRQALTDVLGGNLPADMRNGAVTDYTILPPRINEQQFRNWIDRQTIATLTQHSAERLPPVWGDLRTPVPIEDIINEGTFVMVAPNLYSIRMAADGRPLMTRNGRRFIMRINSDGLIRLPSTPQRRQAPNRLTLPDRGGVM